MLCGPQQLLHVVTVLFTFEQWKATLSSQSSL